MSSEYRLCLILFFWLGCFFYPASGSAGSFLFDSSFPFETFASPEENLNDDLPALRQINSGKTLNTSTGGGSAEYCVPDLRISFSKIDREYRKHAIKGSSLIFVPLRC